MHLDLTVALANGWTNILIILICLSLVTFINTDYDPPKKISPVENEPKERTT